jgi:hypothetical protein
MIGFAIEWPCGDHGLSSNNPDGPSKEAPMHSVPKTFRQVTEEFAPTFPRPTLTRFLFLLFAAILTAAGQVGDWLGHWPLGF